MPIEHIHVTYPQNLPAYCAAAIIKEGLIILDYLKAIDGEYAGKVK